jgi:ankyrin repeat protein
LSFEPLKLLSSTDGVNFLDIDKAKQNCLHLAARAGRAQNVRFILEHKPSMLASKDKKRMTAFGYAC